MYVLKCLPLLWVALQKIGRSLYLSETSNDFQLPYRDNCAEDVNSQACKTPPSSKLTLDFHTASKVTALLHFQLDEAVSRF